MRIIQSYSKVIFIEKVSFSCIALIQTICDGARLYVEKLATILENRGYYDENDNNLFDVTEQVCSKLKQI